MDLLVVQGTLKSLLQHHSSKASILQHSVRLLIFLLAILIPACRFIQPGILHGILCKEELQKCYPDELTGVENSESYIVNGISLWYESDSKVASEQALLYAMLRCDSRRFWASLHNYVKLHMDEDFPLHAQEADRKSVV